MVDATVAFILVSSAAARYAKKQSLNTLRTQEYCKGEYSRACLLYTSCVAGRGYFQVEGKEAVEMKPGDCINIPAEVKHWHGAAPDEWFSHLAIEVPGENSSNEWLEPVSNEEYRKLK